MTPSSRLLPRKRRGLWWSLVSRLLGKPKGRHAAGPPPPPRRLASAAQTLARPAETTSEEPPTEVAVAAAAPLATASGSSLSDLAAVRLIFSDGSAASLPPGSSEERTAHYLAQRVLEATRRH